jgi:hypothetical protein
MTGGMAVVSAGPGLRRGDCVDDHEVAAPAGGPTAQLWVVAAVGRLAGQGLLEYRADSADPVAVAGQRLLIAAGWLDADPFGPSEAGRRGASHGLPTRVNGTAPTALRVSGLPWVRSWCLRYGATCTWAVPPIGPRAKPWTKLSDAPV